MTLNPVASTFREAFTLLQCKTKRRLDPIVLHLNRTLICDQELAQKAKLFHLVIKRHTADSEFGRRFFAVLAVAIQRILDDFLF